MQRSRLHSLVLATLVLVAPWACKKSDSQVRIRVEVKTNQGDPVDKAQILLDGKKLGETSNAGQFSADLELPAGSRKRLEVKKESDTYYFAPYFESFVVSEASRQEISIPALLYFVPKPSPAATSAAAGAAGAAAGVLAGAGVDLSAQAPVTPIPTSDTTPAVAPGDKPTSGSLSPLAAAAAGEPVTSPAAPDDQETKSAAPLMTETAATGDAPVASPELPEENAVAVEENAVAVEGEPKATAVELLSVDEGDAAAPVAKDQAYPKPTRQNEGQTVYTVHVISGNKPVTEAQVFVGEEADSDLKLGCTTNARGRCVVRFAEKPAAAVTFVATKKGYKTGKQTARITDKGNLRIVLEAGQTIDIYAVSKTYNFTSGLKNVEVYIGGKRVGTTDSFGHYSHVYAGKADDLVAIALKPKEYLPETYETDFVASGPMRLVRYFSPKEPPPVRMAVLALKSAGKVTADTATKLAAAERHVRDAAKQHLFASSAFKEFQTALFERIAARAGRSSAEALRKGWQDTELKASVDAVLLPTLALGGSKASLELGVIDSRGRVLAAAVESLDDPEDKESIARAVAQIAKKIARAYPFEGAVLSKDADKAVINIGYSSGRSIKAGDVLDISGVQSEKFGRTQSHRHIASLVVREVNDTSATCAVQSLVPRATIERGDLVALRQRRALDQGSAQVRVAFSSGKGAPTQPVAQANVYLNDAWIGATDAAGRLYADITGLGQMTVIKHGFASLTQQVELKPGAKVDLTLKRETAFVRIDSKPAGVAVKIDGKPIGTTPLNAPVSVPSGFVKLELEAPKGYKSFTSVLELEQDTLELTGAKAIALERDERAEAQRLLLANKVDEAIAKLEEIPPSHSDWLISQHELGEIYLTRLDQPAKAAEAFGRVTATPAVKQFADKRFIGSHIDEAIALFMTGEKLTEDNKEAAVAHYKRSIEIFEAVLPHLRFVKSEQYPQAVHNVDFHRALARHRLWQYSQDPAVLAETLRSWRAYLDGSAQSVPAEGVSKTYVENARVYFKQATASQGRAPEVTR